MNKTNKKVFQGTVISTKMDKTCVVLVSDSVMHARYKKYVTWSKKFQAHDEKNLTQEGDFVTIIECRPYSKHKTWRLLNVLKKAQKVHVGEA